MTNPIIERAARALFDEEHDTASIIWAEADEEERQAWCQSARVVLHAIREPSEAMVKAGSAGGDWPHSQETWQAMIDTALAE